ncbi:MAG: hypothetical protein JXI43_05430, partial [Tissierellales bacterium]|nr:hypothetical protein [Tissierellales bacterium]
GLEEFMKKIKYDIEGEAEFIRYLLWKKHYPCATYFPGSMSLLQKAFCWSLSKVFPGFLKLLQDQYTEGLREYKRKKGI